jgi:two-component sensor histidine kinase
LERRICLSARGSDALFGFTEQPAPLPERLTSLAQATVALLSGSEQAISIDVQAAGSCEPGLASIVVQIAYEMLCNAVKHGMHMRLGGHIGVRLLVQASGRVILQVRDDGWAPEAEPFEEVLSIMQALAAAHGGRVSMSRVDDWNVARLELPGHYRPG